jgi:nitrogen fixation NifU-like protein
VTADLHALYEAAVLDHSRRPRNRRAIEGAHRAEQHNRMCGDRVVVYLRVEHDVIQDVSFEGSACAIAIASASLMTEAVSGQAVARADTAFEGLRQHATERSRLAGRARRRAAVSDSGEVRDARVAGVGPCDRRLASRGVGAHIEDQG